MKSVVVPASSVDEVLDLYLRFGADNYDETVTQLDHALQCAAHALAAEADPALIAAALLHDVGHLLDLAGWIHLGDGLSGGAGSSGAAGAATDAGSSRAAGAAGAATDTTDAGAAADSGAENASTDLRHEQSGSRYLAALFPPTVTAPIALHVRAKRYLCATRPGYEQGLSDGSVASLARQGGAMDDDEVAAFERNPGADAAIRLRYWDDLGKVHDVEVPDLDTYRQMLVDLALR